LAQEITKDSIVKLYPKTKRIDIGYMKKMKYTRYAFVTFKTVDDSIEAFKQTHNREIYSKSLIVRFRRLHGTVGMPGESKPQNPPRADDEERADTRTAESIKINDFSSSTAKGSMESVASLSTDVANHSDKSAYNAGKN